MICSFGSVKPFFYDEVDEDIKNAKIFENEIVVGPILVSHHIAEQVQIVRITDNAEIELCFGDSVEFACSPSITVYKGINYIPLTSYARKLSELIALHKSNTIGVPNKRD